jgi:hypothetical protein
VRFSYSTVFAQAFALQEYTLSAYAPCAPPEGSKLRQVLVSVALGAMSQGKWSCAQQCLQASGEQLLLLLLRALQHDRPALQMAVRQSGTETAVHTLAMLLLAADARIGLRQSLHKDWYMSRCECSMQWLCALLAWCALTCPAWQKRHPWRVLCRGKKRLSVQHDAALRRLTSIATRRSMQDTDARAWPMADRLVPDMKAQANRSFRTDVVADEGEEGPVAPMDVSTLAAHLGLTPPEVLHVVASSAVVTSASAHHIPAC